MPMNQYSEGCASVPVRQPAASEVMSYAQSLAGRAQALADRVNQKLQPVMTSEVPSVGGNSQKANTEYPPLFAELRGSFQSIESALESVESALSRTEL